VDTKFLLEVDNLTARGTGAFLLKDISFKIKDGECMAIYGGTGSGKSTLLKCIRQYKQYPAAIRFANSSSPKVELIEHHHQFKSLAGINNFYYQQRFNSSESDDSVTVLQDLLIAGRKEGEIRAYLNEFQIGHLTDSPLIRLSNGEHKRFQLAKAMLQKPDWLLFDNPFTGLDPAGREMLEGIISKVIKRGTNVLMCTSAHLPDFITGVLILKDGILTGIYKRDKFLKSFSYIKRGRRTKFTLPFPALSNTGDLFNYVLRMKNVNVSYGERSILKGINWSVLPGERWCISGPNGSGKSTLLSLITGDNPQAFANEIYLFDKRRGSGETIWEIKRKIGFVSPEVHQYFDKSFTCFQTVASGLFDTIGLFRKLNKHQRKLAEACMESFQISQHADKPLSSLSNGMQRWVLLARAVIKDPPVFILDEPCQGLDDELADGFISFIETICGRGDKTLIYVTHVESEIPDGMTHFMKLENGIIKEITENGKEHYGNTGGRHRA